jgi:hypothetical protein
MMCDFQLARGDVCGDPTGLRVKRTLTYTIHVHFSVIEKSNSGDDDPSQEQILGSQR